MTAWLAQYGSWLFIGVPTACYIAQAGVYAAQQRPGMSMTLLAYALANGGLMWDAWRATR